MSANLHTVDGKVSFAFAAQDGSAWHGRGNPMRDEAKRAEWLKEAGLDFSVERSQVRFEVPFQGKKVLAKMPSHDILWCSDTKQALAPVGRDYKVVQPAEIMEFFGDWIAAGQMRMTSAGALGERKVIWAQAEFNEGVIITGQDVIKGKLLLTTGLCGNRATEARNVSERVVCANTLAVAMGEDSPMSVRVTHRSVFDADAVKARMAAANEQFLAFVEAARALTKVRVNFSKAEELTQALLRPAGNVNADGKEMRKPSGYDAILSLFQGEAMGATMSSSEGTAWGWLNAVTQHVDHGAKARNDDTRTMSAWLGDGDAAKRTALKMALKLV